MQAFHFRLARVLEYQKTRAAAAEHELQRLYAERHRLEAEREHAAGERLATARALARSAALSGLDLEYLNGYASRMERRRASLDASARECARRCDAQRAAVVEARRKVRLLEKLRERRRGEWTAALNRELDELASDFSVFQFRRR